jgi:glucosamine 6-phosphate synthetase-like amidotransferase/phosphosugar isomerase protein
MQYLRLLARNIAVENEIRGRDSTGFAFFTKNNQSIFKYPMRAAELCRTTAFSHFNTRYLNKSTKNVLIHTRMGTKGSEKNNLNNHPIESHRYVGVHNGMIQNDDMLFAKHNLYRAAEVDSEVIFRLLDTKGDIINDDGLVWAAEQLSGSFTTAFVPKKNKNLMYIIRNDNPITMYMIDSLNVIIFASVELFLKNAISDANEEHLTVNVSFEDVSSLEPKRHGIYKFDTSKDEAMIQLLQTPISFQENYSGWFEYDESYFFLNGAEGVAPSEIDLHTITTKLSTNELETLQEYIRNMESNVWIEGWAKGRASLEEEMNNKIAISYDKGYKEGFQDGYATKREDFLLESVN